MSGVHTDLVTGGQRKRRRKGRKKAGWRYASTFLLPARLAEGEVGANDLYVGRTMKGMSCQMILMMMMIITLAATEVARSRYERCKV